MYTNADRFCPRCEQSMPATNPFETVQCCEHCGFYDMTPNKKAQRASDMKAVRAMIMATLFISMVFMHVNTWGKHSLAIIPLKLHHYAGVMSTDDYTDMAKICVAVELYSCTSEAYYERLKLDPTNLQYNSEYANILKRTGNSQQALVIYKAYFDLGGDDLDTAYDYAKTLEEFSDYENAAQYFEMILKAKPKVFQITVSQDYANMLIKKGDLAKAENFIKKVRRTGTNAPLFMDKELEDIKKSLLVAKK